jgi:ATP-dependent helicase/nuclease subunit B
VLENFWAEVKTQAALKLSMTQTSAMPSSTAPSTSPSRRTTPVLSAGWPSACIDTERQRLLNLLIDWLVRSQPSALPSPSRRAKSGSATSPSALCASTSASTASTSISATFEPAGEIILDYKTGSAAPADWLGPRPDEPQLPLYAVVSNNPNLAAVAFASVRPGNLMGIAGYEPETAAFCPNPQG